MLLLYEWKMSRLNKTSLVVKLENAFEKNDKIYIFTSEYVIELVKDK